MYYMSYCFRVKFHVKQLLIVKVEGTCLTVVLKAARDL